MIIKFALCPLKCHTSVQNLYYFPSQPLSLLVRKFSQGCGLDEHGKNGKVPFHVLVHFHPNLLDQISETYRAATDDQVHFNLLTLRLSKLTYILISSCRTDNNMQLIVRGERKQSDPLMKQNFQYSTRQMFYQKVRL